MRIALIIILSIVLIGISAQIYLVLKERNQLKNDLADLNGKMSALAKENADMKSAIQYFSIPENLAKELKSKFNYKEPGEKMMVVVP